MRFCQHMKMNTVLTLHTGCVCFDLGAQVGSQSDQRRSSPKRPPPHTTAAVIEEHCTAPSSLMIKTVLAPSHTQITTEYQVLCCEQQPSSAHIGAAVSVCRVVAARHAYGAYRMACSRSQLATHHQLKRNHIGGIKLPSWVCAMLLPAAVALNAAEG